MPEKQKTNKKSSLFDRKLVWGAVKDAFKKLDPRLMIRNPVMFVVEVGALLTGVAGSVADDERQ